MKSIKKVLPLFLFLLCFQSAFCQTLEGYVFDKATEKPLQSATVYLDGTTISTATNEQGYFKINGNGNTKSALVITFVGYISSKIENPFQYKKIKTHLEEDAIAIEEVVIGRSPFTRKSMMKVFKEQFLGKSKAGESCKILNEDDINLYYDIETNELSATSRNPIVIKNSYLDYEIHFDLVDFNVQFRSRSLSIFAMTRSFFAGTTFYKDLSKKSKSATRKRDAIYVGSSTHLMNTIANETWEKERFALFVDKFQVRPTDYFKVSDTLNIKKVTVIKEAMKKVPKVKLSSVNFEDQTKIKVEEYVETRTHFSVLHEGKNQSVVDFIDKEFYVDESGNFSPVYGIVFGGYLGTLKVGDMLPMDYYQNIKK